MNWTIIILLLLVIPLVAAKDVTVTLYVNQEEPQEPIEKIYRSPQQKMKQITPYALIGGAVLLSLLILFKK